MTFVADWDTRSRDRIELYADPHAGDGFVILIGAYAPEHAADVTDATEPRPRVTWLGRCADRHASWRSERETALRAALSAWGQSC
ncbi:hypothetical protein [Glycomyces salinus]|uniref:hypothetical protein n=1 Tax=Glycomyces salinus TaxID=980294 RepID=UPI0018EE38FE|nr:hypothetical protein [Glycomyces salinus]